MALSARTLQSAAQQQWRQVRQAVRVKPFALPPAWQVVAATLATIVFSRLLPASVLQGVDGWLGRPGDALLLLAAIVLVGGSVLAWQRGRQPVDVATEHPASTPAQALLAAHLRLDGAIAAKLDEMVGDTESSALAIISDVRKLYDSASTLVGYLDGSSLKASDLGKEISNSVNFLVEIGHFIEELPVTMKRDLASVQDVAREIRAMGGLVEAVHAISMQSHLLAINAAIEASRAGPSGAAFRVIAQEMRTLASDSGNVADQINQGLARARFVVEDGMAAGIADSARRLDEVSLAAVSIQKLQENFEDMTQYYKTRFVVVTKYNEDLAREIADVLGQIQYQDVVRQGVERLQFAVARRNAFFTGMVDEIIGNRADFAALPAQLTAIADEYLSEEDKHKHSARHGGDESGELKIELF